MPSYTASAPGSLMLMGEHAVLHGRHGIVAALDRRITVRLTPRPDAGLNVDSPLGTLEASRDNLTPLDAMPHVAAAITLYRDRLPGGVDITITTDIPRDTGLGSSGAVTVALLGALAAWCNLSTAPADVLQAGIDAMDAAQGFGSGCDIAASALGGVVLWRNRALSAHAGIDLPVVVLYSGRKVPTADVLRHLATRNAGCEGAIETIYDAMDHVTRDGWEALITNQLAAWGRLADINHGLMDALGVCNAQLGAMVRTLREEDGITGAKISGAGLGDCVVGFGSTDTPDLPGTRLPVTVAQGGLVVEAG